MSRYHSVLAQPAHSLEYASSFPLMRRSSVLARPKHISNRSSSSRYLLPAIGCLCLHVCESSTLTSRCEAPIPLSDQEVITISETATITREPSGWKSTRWKILKAFRLWRRLVKLVFTLAPVAALYPLQKLLKWKKSKDENVHDVMMVDNNNVDGPLGWYLNMCLYCVECSGAAVVKLMQWAGSRPDLFGHDFCAVFSRLQDDTTPHSWRYTERVMRNAYGDDWKDRITLGKVIGSGCIGQVYEGTIKEDDGAEQRVAVKGKC